jgi:hypothetical protein
VVVVAVVGGEGVAGGVAGERVVRGGVGLGSV